MNTTRQSEQLYRSHRQSNYRQTDKVFVVLMPIQWIAGIIAALVIAPQTRIGQASDSYAHIWAAVLLGGVVSLVPIVLALKWPGHSVTRYTIAVGQMLMSSLLIHLTGGRIETHFHVFASLAVLSLYRDWRVLVPATVVVAADHLVRGIFYPQSVFGVMTPDNWRWLEHAGWIIFEDIFLVIACLRSQAEMRQGATRTANLDTSEARFSSVAGSASEAIVTADESGTIQFVNSSAENMFGYTADELIGQPAVTLLPEPVRRKQAARIKRYLRRGGDRPAAAMKIAALHRDGSEIPAEASFAVYDGDDGRIITAVVRDLTERKRAEEALKRSERSLSMLTSTFEATIDGIASVDLNNNLITANEKFIEMWKIPHKISDLKDATAEVSNHMLSMLKDPGHMITLMQRSLDAPEEISVDTLELADGRIFERYTRPQKLEGKTSGRLMGFRDVTEQTRSEQTLRDSEQRHRHLFDRNPYPIWVYNRATHRFLAVNEAATRQYGYTRDEFLKLTLSDITPPEDIPLHMKLMADAASHDEVVHLVRHQKKDGTIIDVEVAAQSLVYDGRPARIGLVTDLTERKRADTALKVSENRMRTLLDSMSEGLLQVDDDDRIIYTNNCICEMTGYSQMELVGTDWSRLLVDYEAEFVESINARRRKGISDRYETRIRKKSGEAIWVSVGGAPIVDAEGDVIGSMGVVTDITDRKRSEEQLLHEALHDGLTGLANRTLFMDHLRMTIERGKSKRINPFAVLYLDFDRFKVINDSLGHAEGDKLLKYIARRLETCTRTGDLVARLGGDEFVILLNELDDPGEALLVAERIQASLKASFDLAGREIFTTTSIGITLSTSGHTSADDMLRDADIAMYCAKAKGKAQYQIFDEDMHSHASKKLHIETEMRLALERGEFRLHYQPIVRLDTYALVGFEALIRWQHPERGMVPPDDFIPIAEENGMIIKLGQWTVRESCRQLREWQRREPLARDLSVSVNLSCREFLQIDLAEQVAAALKATKLDPRCLKLEITESHIMENSEMAVTIINRLKDLGVEMSLDDFGTGYSSLSCLHRLPVTFLKIDRSFVGRMVESEENREIVHTIIRLGKNLKKKVIAEGIETTDQIAHLADLNCEYAQGYFFSRPLDPESAKKFIAESGSHATRPPLPPTIDRLELNM